MSSDNFLGWQTAASAAPALVEKLTFLRETLTREFELREIIVLGIGGSALAARLFAQLYAPQLRKLGVRLRILDTTEPRTIISTLAYLDAPHTLLIVSSKSGTTIEPLSLAQLFFAQLKTTLGSERAAAERCIAISDAGTPLGDLATSAGWRASIVTPANVSGRFSALTAFGLAPVALAGVALDGLLTGAQKREIECTQNPRTAYQQTADTLYAEAKRGRDKLLLSGEYDDMTTKAFILWLEQLLAESLGKDGKGLIPVVTTPERAKALLACGASDLQELSFCGARPTPELIGGELVRWMFITQRLGELLGVDPFSQPDVARTKAATQRALHKKREAIVGEGVGDVDSSAEILSIQEVPGLDALPPLVRPDDYLTLLTWLPETDANRARLEALMIALERSYQRPVCLEFGPHYLHATGQLHKGGPNTGVYVFVTEKNVSDLAIPAAPYTLRHLYQAQQKGDEEALTAQGRRIVQVVINEY